MYYTILDYDCTDVYIWSWVYFFQISNWILWYCYSSISLKAFRTCSNLFGNFCFTISKMERTSSCIGSSSHMNLGIVFVRETDSISNTRWMPWRNLSFVSLPVGQFWSMYSCKFWRVVFGIKLLYYNITSSWLAEEVLRFIVVL